MRLSNLNNITLINYMSSPLTLQDFVGVVHLKNEPLSMSCPTS